jgi:hypothetical protein
MPAGGRKMSNDAGRGEERRLGLDGLVEHLLESRQRGVVAGRLLEAAHRRDSGDGLVTARSRAGVPVPQRHITVHAPPAGLREDGAEVRRLDAQARKQCLRMEAAPRLRGTCTGGGRTAP